MAEFQELIRTRHATRSFDGRPISTDVLYTVIADASLTPSARNTQPWRFWVTNTPEENRAVAACLQDDGKHAFLDSASAFILLLEEVPTIISCAKYGNDHFVPYDVGEACAYLTLAAKDHGIDTCIIGWVNPDSVRRLTGRDANCALAVALGYDTNQSVPEKKRLPLENLILNYKENK